MASATLLFMLGFAVSILSGQLGIGGGILMAPLLLYLPPLLGMDPLDMGLVSGLTITQGLFACLTGAILHHKQRQVNARLVAWMGGFLAVSALAGSLCSRWVPHEMLMQIFAGLALVAAGLMLLPKTEGEMLEDGRSHAFSVPTAVTIALVIGFLGGMVGQGGSFILIPLMLHVLKLPTRMAIGSNLALVFFSSLAGFVGKLAIGQVPLLPAAFLVVGAFLGARIGSALSVRTRPVWLRRALAVVVAIAAVGISVDAFGL